jgi:hypothetical protein
VRYINAVICGKCGAVGKRVKTLNINFQEKKQL